MSGERMESSRILGRDAFILLKFNIKKNQNVEYAI